MCKYARFVGNTQKKVLHMSSNMSSLFGSLESFNADHCMNRGCVGMWGNESNVLNERRMGVCELARLLGTRENA